MSLRLIFRRWLGEQLRRVRRYAYEVATIGPRDRPAQRFHYFGEGAGLVAPQGVILNERYISIGDGTLVGPGVTMSAGFWPGQEISPSPVVSIGRRCVIGRNSHIVGHERISIGDDVQTGPGVYVTDQNHSYDDPEIPIGLQVPRNSAVEVGAGSWIGAHAVLLPGTRLGRNTVVAAGAVVRGSFGDYTVLAGVPARVVKQWDDQRGWIAR
ncbi:MAG: acyltransferase [Acidimicrobiaceae bacterium]|nr:acyltransferase [Acidimicrobiaceae bacterium]